MQNKIEDVADFGVKVAGGFVIFGLTPAEWAAAATAVYFTLQSAYLLWKWWKESRNDNAPK